MKYRRLGNTGAVVSEIALGTMQFGGAGLGDLDFRATRQMVHLALDKGVNFIDTADIYGRGASELLVGKALAGIRHEVILATKARLPMSDTNLNRAGANRVNLMRGIESSLERLKTDYIDLYQVHSWDSSTPLEETLRTLDDLVRQGKVRYIGFSNYLAWQGAMALGLQERLGLEKFATAQMYYSLVGRDLEHEFLDFAAYSGLGILVWSPLAGGFLSGKYHRSSPPPVGTRFAEAGRFVPFDKESGWRVLDAQAKVASRLGVSPARVALAWLLGRPAITSVIAAARSLEHLGDNLAASGLDLSEEDRRELEHASNPGIPYPKWMVLQHDVAEDPRLRTLHPELFEAGGTWEDLRGKVWEG